MDVYPEIFSAQHANKEFYLSDKQKALRLFRAHVLRQYNTALAQQFRKFCITLPHNWTPTLKITAIKEILDRDFCIKDIEEFMKDPLNNNCPKTIVVQILYLEFKKD